MPFDGSGNFNRVMRWQNDAAAQIKIRADRHDQEDDNLASGLSQCLTKDGQSQPSANIPMNGKKLINLAAPTDPTDAATKGYADGLRNFNTAINLTGAVPEARIGFTQADIGFGARVAGTPAGTGNRFVWNDKPDLSGADVMVLNEAGELTAERITAKASVLNTNAIGTGNAHLFFNNSAGAERCLIYANNNSDLVFRVGAQAVTMSLTAAGNLAVPGQITAVGQINAVSNFVSSNVSAVFAATGAGTVYLRPNGPTNGAGQSYLDSNGNWTMSGSINMAGSCTVGTGLVADTVTATTGSVVSRGSGTGNAHVIFQNNIGGVTGYCYFNNSTNTLNLQNQTGSAGVLQILTSAELRYSNNLVTKPTAGQWTATSDARIKNVVGDYDVGLDAIRQITPKIFTYKGNETSEPPGTDPLNPEAIAPRAVLEAPYSNSMHYQMAVDGTEVVGLIAQEVETVMPSLVTQQPAYIDGEPVDDLRNVDPTNLQYAMVNAIKELATRVEALEAA